MFSAVDAEPGEEIFFYGHPSWRSLAPFYVKGLLASLVAGAIAGLAGAAADGRVQVGWVVAVVLVAYLVLIAVGQIRRIQTTYSITNRRLTIEVGLLSRELHQTRLERVQNVSTRQSLADRLLYIGTVDFDTAAEADFDFSFHGVSNPRGIVKTVDRALHALRGGEAADPSLDF
jgi:uncharacterized membrane protein YdbT with pleckstrin-like domain